MGWGMGDVSRGPLLQQTRRRSRTRHSPRTLIFPVLERLRCLELRRDTLRNFHKRSPAVRQGERPEGAMARHGHVVWAQFPAPMLSRSFPAALRAASNPGLEQPQRHGRSGAGLPPPTPCWLPTCHLQSHDAVMEPTQKVRRLRRFFFHPRPSPLLPPAALQLFPDACFPHMCRCFPPLFIGPGLDQTSTR